MRFNYCFEFVFCLNAFCALNSAFSRSLLPAAAAATAASSLRSLSHAVYLLSALCCCCLGFCCDCWLRFFFVIRDFFSLRAFLSDFFRVLSRRLRAQFVGEFDRIFTHHSHTWKSDERMDDGRRTPHVFFSLSFCSRSLSLAIRALGDCFFLTLRARTHTNRTHCGRIFRHLIHTKLRVSYNIFWALARVLRYLSCCCYTTHSGALTDTVVVVAALAPHSQPFRSRIARSLRDVSVSRGCGTPGQANNFIRRARAPLALSRSPLHCACMRGRPIHRQLRERSPALGSLSLGALSLLSRLRPFWFEYALCEGRLKCIHKVME